MKRRSDTTRRPSVRPTQEQLERLKERAAASGMSVNQYLLTCGLGGGHVPSARELELRERAVFEVRWAAHELDKINRRLDRGFELSSEKVQGVLDQLSAAARSVGAAFDEQEAPEDNR